MTLDTDVNEPKESKRQQKLGGKQYDGSGSGIRIRGGKNPDTRIVINMSDHIPERFFGLQKLKFFINSVLQIWDGKTRSGINILDHIFCWLLEEDPDTESSGTDPDLYQSLPDP
jgi:hypothetical protein